MEELGEEQEGVSSKEEKIILITKIKHHANIFDRCNQKGDLDYGVVVDVNIV